MTKSLAVILLTGYGLLSTFAAFGDTIYYEVSGTIIRPTDFVPSVAIGDLWSVSYEIGYPTIDDRDSNPLIGQYRGMVGSVTVSGITIPVRPTRIHPPADRLLENGTVFVLVDEVSAPGNSIVALTAEKFRSDRPLIDGRELRRVSVQLAVNPPFVDDSLINSAKLKYEEIVPSPPVWEDDGIADTQVAFSFISGASTEFFIGNVTSFTSIREFDIAIDVLPQKVTNRLDLHSSGYLQVAILSTDVTVGDLRDFDAMQVDPSTLKLGPAMASVAGRFLVKDIDKDGDSDLNVEFRISELGVSCADTAITLTGKTYAGDLVRGTDSISPKGCD